MPKLVSKSLKPPIQQSLEAIDRTAGLGSTARSRQAWGAGCGRDVFGKYRRRFSGDGLLLGRWGSSRWSERQGDSDPEPSKTIQMQSVGEPRILRAEKPDSWGCLSLIRIRDAAVTGRAWGGSAIPSAWGVLGESRSSTCGLRRVLTAEAARWIATVGIQVGIHVLIVEWRTGRPAALKEQEEAGKQWGPRGSRSPWGGRAEEPLAFLHPVVLRSLINQSLSASNNSP